jgi:hypothetical protein
VLTLEQAGRDFKKLLITNSQSRPT